MSLKYRPEIDGLRAVSVVAVVLYHAEFSFFGITLFGGGFIGVDVFFVISGYLITSIIIGEMTTNEFSFAAFYERRARRILPALFSVMLATIPFAWVYMLPKALKDYAASALSALAFGSNIWFWQNNGYAAEPSALEPFLHTWSLSVEEQFYLLFPVFIFLLFIKTYKYRIFTFVIIFLISLIISDIGSTRYVDANFYLLPSRIWELFAGGVLAQIGVKKGCKNISTLESSLSAFGLVLIFGAILFFNDTINHPSFVTLIPVAGAVLIIWFGNRSGYAFRILSSKPFVSVGLISYSLYLWHFPVFAFFRITSNDPTPLDKIGWIGLSLILSIGSYFVIEKTARNRDILPKKFFLLSVLAVFTLLISVFSFLYLSNGAPERLGLTEEDSFRDNFFHADKSCHDYETPCVIGYENQDIRFVLVGDSHAGAIGGVFAPRLLELGGYAQFTAGACSHIVNMENNLQNESLDDKCSRRSEQFDEFLRDNKNLIIIHFAHYNYWLQGEVGSTNSKPVLEIRQNSSVGSNDIRSHIRSEIQRWVKLGHQVYFILQPPEFNENPLKLLAAGRNTNDIYIQRIAREAVALRRKMTLDIVEAIDDTGFTIVDPLDIFCAEKFCSPVRGKKILYTDVDHLSRSGALLLWEEFYKQFRNRSLAANPR